MQARARASSRLSARRERGRGRRQGCRRDLSDGEGVVHGVGAARRQGRRLGTPRRGRRPGSQRDVGDSEGVIHERRGEGVEIP